MLVGCQPWPPDKAESYRRAGYWQDRTLGDCLSGWANLYGERIALVDGERRWSYTEVDRRVDQLTQGLWSVGVRAGDRIITQLPNIPEFVVVCFALFRLGALPVLTPPSHRIREVADLYEASGAVGYIAVDTHADFDYRELARSLRPVPRMVLILGAGEEFISLAEVMDPQASGTSEISRPDPDEVAFFLLSGGTTGTPKLIPRTHTDYEYNVRASAELCRLNESTVYLTMLPVTHNFALGCPGIIGALHAGGTVVFARNPSPPKSFRIIEKEHVTITALVPSLALLWARFAKLTPCDLSSMRQLQVGGAKLTVESARWVRDTLGCQLQQVYGMAEGLLNYTRPDDPDDLVFSTQGRPLSPADEIRIVDGNDDDVESDQVGELLTRGPYTIRGYFRAEAYNSKSFSIDGYYRTGDLVRCNEAGYLIVEGRAKDVVNRGGEKISAQEVEDHLLAHPAIHEVAVVAVPDARLGELTCAFVIPSGTPPTLNDLTSFLRERGLASYKYPDRLRIIGSLPATPVGKIDKKRLASLFAADHGSAGSLQ